LIVARALCLEASPNPILDSGFAKAIFAAIKSSAFRSFAAMFRATLGLFANMSCNLQMGN
jgi:hypothetical protein